MSEAKPKQAKLANFTEIEDDDVEGLAEAYVEARDAWQDAGKEMGTRKKALLEGAKKNKKILDAAKAHPKGKVKVGDALLTVKAKNPTLDIRVKMYGEESEEEDEGAEAPAGGEQEAAE